MGYLLAATFTKHFGQLKIHVFIERVSGWLASGISHSRRRLLGGAACFQPHRPIPIAGWLAIRTWNPSTGFRTHASLAHGRLARNLTDLVSAICIPGSHSWQALSQPAIPTPKQLACRLAPLPKCTLFVGQNSSKNGIMTKMSQRCHNCVNLIHCVGQITQ